MSLGTESSAPSLPGAGSAPRLSIVAPCLDEEACLREFHARANAAASTTVGKAYEIILVDDGSGDATWDVMQELSQNDPRTVAVRLIRNHGHQVAASAGLALASGETVLLIDADLQDPPELLPKMMQIMVAERADVVFGRRIMRHGESRFKRLSAYWFYLMLSKLSGVRIPRNVGDFRLMSRRVVQVLNAMPERRRFLRGMVSWVGGRQVPCDYERHARFAGHTKYPLSRMFRLAVDALTGFSTAPLRLASILGFAAAAAAIPLGVISLEGWLNGRTVAGWTSIMTAIAFFSAIQLLVLGILGSYIGRLSDEAKSRPLFIIDCVQAGGRDCVLPAEFASLPTTLRNEVWATTRAAAMGLSGD